MTRLSSSTGVGRLAPSAAALALLLLSLTSTVVQAEIRPYKGGVIRAASYEIHYSEGYLVTPGYVDVSGLTFEALDGGGGGGGYVRDDDDDDDMVLPPDDDGKESTPAPVSSSPTKAPVTASPTPAPVTKAPKPTEAPVTSAPVTSAPTKSPVSAAPTKAPVTASPTKAPVSANATTTATPTKAPVTAAPTEAPVTAAPTEAPTQKPVEPAEPAAPPEGGGNATARAAPASPPPVTAAPTEAPVTAAPVSAAPTKGAVAATAAPVSAAPTSAPVTAAPVTAAPVTAAPSVAPVTAAPVGDRTRLLEEETKPGSSALEIVVFHEPESCSKAKKGCDWTELGIGASDGEGNTRWCCSDDAVALGFCSADKQHGRLIVNPEKFKGRHRLLPVPPTGRMPYNSHIKDGKMEFDVEDESGRYVMVIANCDDFGRDLTVSGSYEYRSAHGYLPGELFGAMYFFAAITLVYLVLFIWYGCSMQCYKDSRIPVQKWIIVSIGLGLLECFFKTGDYFVWNEDGARVWYATYVGVILGVIKGALSRSLIVMVSLGWGVVRDDLGTKMRKIWFLGILYVGVACAAEIVLIIFIEDMTVMSEKVEEELFDVDTILTFVLAAINVIYFMWILDALNSTMQYLENMSQNMKMKQYLRLRYFFLLSMLFAIMWAVFGIVNSQMDSPILEDKQEWSIQAAWQLNYLFILTGVACLWRPTANAKEYAYVMELPSMDTNGEMHFETNADTIDDDDDLSDHPSGDDPEEDGDGLRIEDAVKA